MSGENIDIASISETSSFEGNQWDTFISGYELYRKMAYLYVREGIQYS